MSQVGAEDSAARTCLIRDYLRQAAMTTRAQVEAALQQRDGVLDVPVGQLLLAEDVISERQLECALELKRRCPGVRLGDLLVRGGAVDPVTLRRVLAARLGVPTVDLSAFHFEPVRLNAPDRQFMREHGIVPLFQAGARLVVAVEDPLDTAPLQRLAFGSGLKVDAVLAPRVELAAALARGVADSNDSVITVMSRGRGHEPSGVVPGHDAVMGSGAHDVVQLVDTMIRDAFGKGASDIHIEASPATDAVRVRFRKDGVLHHYADVPAHLSDALVARIKILSKLDIAEKRHAQDGKFRFSGCAPVEIELRVVTIPTAEGAEDIVMRLQVARSAMLPHQLGLAPDVLSSLLRIIRKPHGLILVCGPTGSGKTTTLHALLGALNSPERKIWTVEDPIEITQPGLRQVQVQSKIGWTFAAILRSFLRADPDIIMVGETRDLETARIVAEAALTGHLVLSTMHTNSAVDSVARLLDLGLDPFFFADTLVGVLAQRLVRRLCPGCSRPYAAHDDELEALARAHGAVEEHQVRDLVMQWKSRYGDLDGQLWLRAVGSCPECDHSGYKGRLGVHELLVANEEIKAHIAMRSGAQVLSRLSAGTGLRTLRQDGIEKVIQGHTSWAEVSLL